MNIYNTIASETLAMTQNSPSLGKEAHTGQAPWPWLQAASSAPEGVPIRLTQHEIWCLLPQAPLLT